MFIVKLFLVVMVENFLFATLTKKLYNKMITLYYDV